jgi:cytochrome b6-f complex iron-sulfur subunit
MTGDQSARMASEDETGRRAFLGKSSTLVMASGLAAGYGTLAYQVGTFLYPADAGRAVWQFVCTLDQLAVGESLSFVMPSGAKIVVARQVAGDSAESFVALSSVCPHLGCKVHWEAVNDRFFCPCHNGAFDASGKATEGPPAKANQQLTRFPLRVEGNLLLIQVPLESITVSQPEGSA